MPLNEALQLCMTHKMIEDVSDLYDLMINNSNTPLNVRLNYFLDYANHCATWGQLEKAIALLMKRLKL